MNDSHSSDIPDWIPEMMLDQLDLSELAVSDPALPKECESLGIALDANVAAYRANPKGQPHGLCSFFRAAELDEEQVQQLHLSEQKFKDIVFVAYSKPLRRHDETIVSSDWIPV